MNEMQVYQPLPPAEVINIANAFYASGCFSDAKSAAVLIVKIQAGQELGIAPFAAVSGIHLIQGKPTVGAGILAARVKGSGKYNFETVKHDDATCSLDFFEGKKKLGNSTFTVDDARKAGTKNMDKYPKNMLFARAISNGVKWFTPDIFMGPVYVPEDFDQVTEDTNAQVTTAPIGSASQAATPLVQAPPPAASATPVLETLTQTHPNWTRSVDFIKTGGTVDSMRIKYVISPEVENALLNAAKGMTNQAQAHAVNAGYVADITMANDPLGDAPF